MINATSLTYALQNLRGDLIDEMIFSLLDRGPTRTVRLIGEGKRIWELQSALPNIGAQRNAALAAVAATQDMPSMSAIGTKRTSLSALHMSAFDPKRI